MRASPSKVYFNIIYEISHILHSSSFSKFLTKKKCFKNIIKRAVFKKSSISIKTNNKRPQITEINILSQLYRINKIMNGEYVARKNAKCVTFYHFHIKYFLMKLNSRTALTLRSTVLR